MPVFLFMLTIILSTLDRYATRNNTLLIGPSADFVRDCVGEERYATAHIRPSSDHSALPADTTHILLYGESAMQQWAGKSGLDAWRGFVQPTMPRGLSRPVPTVATYTPVDCTDIKDYENHDDDENDEGGGGNQKDTAPTARRNYRFWAMCDTAKLFSPYSLFKPQTSLMLASMRDIEKLYSTHDSIIYFDIETHPDTNTLQCFGLAVDDGPVLSFPVYDYRGSRVCDPNILSLLAILFANNTCVVHNAAFDLPFLAVNYRVPFGRRIADTMVMHHRAFPEAEKSLAHAISLWTNAPYHKGDAGTFHPHNRAQMDQLLTYNMRDVDTLREVYQAQLRYASQVEGLTESMSLGNRSMYPYLVSGLNGFNIDLRKRTALVNDLEKRVRLYQKLLDILVGGPFNAGSSKQCADYFHTDLGYKVVKKSQKTGAPSLAGDALYLLLLEYPYNPVPRVILAMRDAEKQLTQLTFKPLNWVHQL